MRLVWVVIPLVLIGIVGISESFAENVNAIAIINSSYESAFTGHSDQQINWIHSLSQHRTELTPPPLKQLEYGIELKNILCIDNSVLIFKPSDSSPACVTKSTYEELLDRGWESSPFESKQELQSLKLNKEILVKLFSKLHINKILLIDEQFSIHDKLYLSSECPICFDKIDYKILLEILDWFTPSFCNQEIIYEGCIVHLDASKSYDPDGNEIDVYNWYRSKGLAHSFGGDGTHTWNYNMTPNQQNQFDSFNQFYWYIQSLNVCCYGKINFVKNDSTLTFFAPDVPFDISMSFKLEVFDSSADKFSKPDHITLRIRDT